MTQRRCKIYGSQGTNLTYSRLAQLVERVTSNWAMACLRNDEVSRSSRLMGILFCPVLDAERLRSRATSGWGLISY
jgi:hypothetical protein